MFIEAGADSVNEGDGTDVQACLVHMGRTGGSLAAALAFARELDSGRRRAGFDQDALDTAARKGLALGAFEETSEDGEAIVEEFVPETTTTEAGPARRSKGPSLGQKLAAKAEGAQHT